MNPMASPPLRTLFRRGSGADTDTAWRRAIRTSYALLLVGIATMAAIYLYYHYKDSPFHMSKVNLSQVNGTIIDPCDDVSFSTPIPMPTIHTAVEHGNVHTAALRGRLPPRRRLSHDSNTTTTIADRLRLIMTTLCVFMLGMIKPTAVSQLTTTVQW